jgi:hypothetical protein
MPAEENQCSIQDGAISVNGTLEQSNNFLLNRVDSTMPA